MARVGFVFDMDGTLLDLEPLHFAAWQRAVRQTRKDGTKLSHTFIESCVGIPTQDVGRRVAKEVGITDANALTELKRKIFRNTSSADVRAFDGVVDAIDSISRGPVKLGFCTGSDRDVANSMLEASGLSKYFDPEIRISNDDVEHSKPHPEPYVSAAKQLSLPSDTCFAFEDSPTGCTSAKRANYRCVLGITTSFDASALKKAGADVIFPTTAEAIRWATNRVSRQHLLICDFDHSLIDCNSDTHIFKVLDPELVEEMKTIRKTDPRFGKGKWTALMDHMITKLLMPMKPEDRRAKLVGALSTCPMFDEVKTILTRFKRVHGKRGRIIVLSDANTFFIDVILRHLKIRHLFEDVIYSNSASWERVSTPEAGEENAGEVLRVRPYHDGSHKCNLCPPNLCKGQVMRTILASYGDKQRPIVAYLGDGGGDFCPCANLSQGDVVFARKNWTLHRKLLKIKTREANLFAWENGSDLIDGFRQECFI